MTKLISGRNYVVRQGRLDLTPVERFPRNCHHEATRNGESQPCEAPAVAVKVDEEGHPFPVCAYHARGLMVPLTEILAWGGAA